MILDQELPTHYAEGGGGNSCAKAFGRERKKRAGKVHFLNKKFAPMFHVGVVFKWHFDSAQAYLF